MSAISSIRSWSFNWSERLNPTRLNRWAAVLAAIVLVAYLGFRVADLLWHWILPVSSEAVVKGSQAQAPSDATRQVASVEATLKALKRFNPWEEARPEVKAVAPASQTEEAVASQLDLELKGTMVLPGGEAYAILVRPKNRKEQMALQVGSVVDGATLETIERNAVYFRNGDRLEVIIMATEFGEGDNSSAKKEPVKRRTIINRRVSRARFNELAAQGLKLLKGIQVAPFYEGNETLGYRMNARGRSDLMNRFGVLNGDVIQRINGIPVTDPGQIGPFLKDIQKQSELQLELLREGRPRTIQVRIGG